MTQKKMQAPDLQPVRHTAQVGFQQLSTVPGSTTELATPEPLPVWQMQGLAKLISAGQCIASKIPIALARKKLGANKPRFVAFPVRHQYSLNHDLCSIELSGLRRCIDLIQAGL